MGYENFLRINNLTPSLSVELVNYLKNIKNTELLSINEHDQSYELLLKFSGTEKREKWPEDITINLSSDKIYLCFHTGNGKVREEIYDDIISTLERLSLSFDEEED